MSKFPKLQIKRLFSNIINTENSDESTVVNVESIKTIKSEGLSAGEPLTLLDEELLLIGQGSEKYEGNVKKVEPTTKAYKAFNFEKLKNFVFWKPNSESVILEKEDGSQLLIDQKCIYNLGESFTDLVNELNKIWEELRKKANILNPEFEGIPKYKNEGDIPNLNKDSDLSQLAALGTLKTYVENQIKEYNKSNYIKKSKYGTNQMRYYVMGHHDPSAEDHTLYYNESIYIQNGILYGAGWNDFAEFRECKGEPGTVVCEVGDGSLEKSSERLQPGAAIISDTYGMVIGNRGNKYKPIAVAGRVLAKYDGDLSEFKPGMPVCAGPNGKIVAMTKDESWYFPESIIGYVSEIPTYKHWNDILVGDRIWIKIK